MTHPRTRSAQTTEAQFRFDVWRLIEASDMTAAEAAMAIVQILSDLQRAQLRIERHPKHDCKADEACGRKGCPGFVEGQ